MTVLVRLAVLVLLVYCVQGAVPKTRQNQSQPDKNRPKEQHVHAKSETQLKIERTDAKSNKIQLNRNDAQNEKRTSKSSSTKHEQKTVPKHEGLEKAKKSANHAKKAPPSAQKKKVQPKKKEEKKKPIVVNEFPLNDIIFKGRATNEANAFLKANDKVGKALELIYEHAREQDLNELEDQIRRRMTVHKR